MSDLAANPGMPRLCTRDFVALLVPQAAFGYSSAAFQMLPKFLATELAADAAQIGAVVATFGIASVVATPFMGTLVDRLGRRSALATGGLLLAATALGFSAVEELGPLVFALRALQGLAFSLAFVGGSTLAVDEAPAERLAQALGIFGLTMLSMNAVGPVVTEELAQRSGWSLAFVAAGGGGLACALLSRLLPEPARGAEHAARGPGLSEVLARPRLLRLSAVVMLAAAACGTMFAFHQPFALSLGIERVGTFFAAYAIAAIIVRVGAGQWIDRIGRRRVAIACLALYAGVVAAMAALDQLGLLALGAAFGVAHGLFFPACNALALEDTPPGERGKVMAIFIGAFNLGFAVGPLLLGRVADAVGFPWVFAIAASGVLLALPLLVLSRNA
jgi:MFS family permease